MSKQPHFYRIFIILALVFASLIHADPMYDQYEITSTKNIYGQPPIADVLNIPQSSEALQSAFTNTGKHSFAEYYDHYFQSWNKPYSFDVSELHEIFAKRKPRYLENYALVTDQMYQQLQQNANLRAKGSLNVKGIVMHNTMLRKLPTNSVMFANPNEVAEGFPFDYLQDDYLILGEPVLISHYTKDQKFAYVLSSSGSPGFVMAQDIAVVDDQFTKDFQKNLVMLTKDTLGYLDTDQYTSSHELFMTSVLPLQKPGVVLVPIQNAKGKVELVAMRLKENDYIEKPLIYSAANVQMMIDRLINKPYGWGGVLYHMDCARLVRNYFAVFGTHLPLLTKQQKDCGAIIDVSNLNAEQKKQMIMEKAIPYQSFLYLPGHIALYLGTYNSEPIMLHAKWGLKLYDQDKNEFRYVIGKSIISTLTPGKELIGFSNEKSNLLKKITIIANFNPAQSDSILLQAEK